MSLTFWISSFVNEHGAFNSKTSHLKNVLAQKVNPIGKWCKISVNKRKKRTLNDLIKKLDKTSSTDRTLAGGPRSSRTHEDTKVVFSLKKGDQPEAEKICWFTGTKKTRWITPFALKQLSVACVKHIVWPIPWRSYRRCPKMIFHTGLFVFSPGIP